MLSQPSRGIQVDPGAGEPAYGGASVTGGMQKSGKGTHAGGTVAFLCRIRTAGASAVSKGPLSEPLLSPCRTGTDSVLPVSLPRPCSR